MEHCEFSNSNCGAQSSGGLDRRDFLKGTSLAAMMALMGGIELRAEPVTQGEQASKPPDWMTGPTVKCGVIGLGPWGREIVTELSRMAGVDVAAICDTYPAALARAAACAPKAEQFDSYKQLLASKEVQAIIVATPTHLHRDIVLAALAAGKHVYCEAPLAVTIDDARTIAVTARSSVKSLFQSGLQLRCAPLRMTVAQFMRGGTIGKMVMARAQYHRKKSWAVVSPDPTREKEVNWRLCKQTSLGLIGEMGIHQLDFISWCLKSRPSVANGVGAICLYQDGRDVPDTIQSVLEYAGGVRFLYDATLCNSFDAGYENIYGIDGTLMIRDNRAWLFREEGSPPMGWETYSRKEKIFNQTGIRIDLTAGSSDRLFGHKDDWTEKDKVPAMSPLSRSLEIFTRNAGLYDSCVKDYIEFFGDDDLEPLKQQLRQLKLTSAPGWKEGYEATVLAIKANEAVIKTERIEFQDEWFEIS